MGKKVEFEIEGKKYWYHQQIEDAQKRYMAEKKAILDGPLVTAMKEWIDQNRDDDFYDAKLLAELVNYPDPVKEHFGVTSARHGKIEKKPAKMEDLPDYTLEKFSVTLSEPWDKARQDMYAKYPLTPDQAFPASGPQGLRGPTGNPGPLGKPIIFGTGGDISEGLEKFQELWNDSGMLFSERNNLGTKRGSWKAHIEIPWPERYKPKTMSYTMKFIDFSKKHYQHPFDMGEDEILLIL